MVIAGVIARGEGVFAPAECGHLARKLAGLERGGALEHHVLQHMGHARGAVHLVHGAHPHPQHVHRRGRAAVGFDDDGQAISQGEPRNLGWGLRVRRRGKPLTSQQAQQG